MTPQTVYCHHSLARTIFVTSSLREATIFAAACSDAPPELEVVVLCVVRRARTSSRGSKGSNPRGRGNVVVEIMLTVASSAQPSREMKGQS